MVDCSEEKHERLARSYNYCYECGAPLGTEKKIQQWPPCPYCGKTTSIGWRFCGWCGQPLKEES